MKPGPSKFGEAVDTVEEFVSQPVVTKLDFAGLAFAFSFTFELAWPELQAKIAEQGYLERGPRPSVKAAFQAGLIPVGQEEAWATMMEDRNLVAHTYKPDWARKLVDRIRDEHLPLLKDLVMRLRA